jgi:predicted  nucleic acid-binding Zn-ribbon protein
MSIHTFVQLLRLAIQLLLEHKLQSSVLQTDMATLSQQIDSVDGERADLANELSKLEGQIKEIERQMRELSKISAIQDGRINVAHARKKRNLDHEFEDVFEKASERRSKLAAVEDRLKALEDERNGKEEHLKELESTLVKILVDQQTKLLAVLATSQEEATRRAKAKKREMLGKKKKREAPRPPPESL